MQPGVLKFANEEPCMFALALFAAWRKKPGAYLHDRPSPLACPPHSFHVLAETKDSLDRSH